jgi:ABC-type transporter Mla subunit MlaD
MAQPFKFRHLNRIVGTFVLAATLVLLGGVLLVARARHWLEPQFVVEVRFSARDIGLLRTGLPVKILGEGAGEVIEAHLASASETSATLTLRESFKARLRADCYAVIHTPVAGLIGETFVEVWPGNSTQPRADDQPIHSKVGEDLVELARRSVESFGDASGQLRDLISENRKEISQAIVNVRRMSENLDRLVADNRELVGTVLTKLEAMGRQVSELVAENRGSLKQASERLPAAIDSLGAGGQAIAEAGKETQRLFGENREDFRLIVSETARAAPEIRGAATDLHLMTSHAAQGQGSAGKFIMDDDTHDTVVAAADELKQRLEEVKPITGGLSELKLYGGAEGGWDGRSGSYTAAVYLRLEPHPWKFYQGGVSYRSAPRDRRDLTTESPDSIPVDFSLLLGWRFAETATKGIYWLTLAGGMVETRVGGYVEAPLWGDRLALRALVRQKQNNREPNDRRYEHGEVLVRATASLRVWRTTWLVAGVDDCVDAPGVWVGARLEFLDNDLRNLTSVGGLLK